MIEKTMEILLAEDGEPLRISALGESYFEEVEPVLAITPDDKVVTVIGCDYVSSYRTERLLWHFDPESTVQMPAGLYEAMKGFMSFYRAEIQNRQNAKRGIKRFRKGAYFSGYWALTDAEFAQEVIERGWAAILAEY